MTTLSKTALSHLQQRLKGDVYTDIIHRVVYSVDASIYRVVPQCVVIPRAVEDVQVVVQFALDEGIPLAPRGAGSGVAGESLCEGIVLDTSRYMKRILAYDPETQIVTCEPGVVLDQLNAQLAVHGQKIGPDPSSGNRATIGGSVANNATGSHSLQYGHLDSYVTSCEFILADAHRARFENRMRLHEHEGTHAEALAGQCLDLLSRSQDIIRKAQPETTRNRCGYQLADVLQGDTIDMARLLVGSEGTLGIFSEISIQTVPIPPAKALLQLEFDSLTAMAEAVPVIVAQGATTCELMDQRLLNMARETLPQYRDIFPEKAAALLLVEHAGEDEAAVREAITKTSTAVRSLTSGHRDVYDLQEQQRLWKSRKDAVPLLYRDTGTHHPVPFMEDVSVPHTRLAAYIQGLDKISKDHDIHMAYFGHAGDGELHVRPYLDLNQAEDVKRMRTLAEQVFGLAWSLGGTISGEHGCGLVRSGFMKQQYGDAYYKVLESVKQTFDPKGVLNPGKIVGAELEAMTQQLRRGVGFDPKRLDTPLEFETDELAHEILQCNSCGLCRNELETLRMCPIFRALGEEIGSSRAKVAVLDYWATGQLEESDFQSTEFRAFMELCVNCKACQKQCPSGVDVSKIMMAARAQLAQERGLRMPERVLSQNRLMSTMGSMMAPLANIAIRVPLMGWVLEKVGGLDCNHQLPSFSWGRWDKQTQNELADLASSEPRDRVVYFVDSVANYHDHNIGGAVLTVLKANGIDVVIPPKQRPTPLPAVCYGDTKRARQDFAYIVDQVGPWVEQGYTIICSESSAALALQQDLRHFVTSEVAERVSESTLDLMDYLWTLHDRGGLESPKQKLSGTFAYHRPCHIQALEGQTPTLKLLHEWGKVEVVDLAAGCCGLSGTYGLQKRHADLSETISRRLHKALNDLPSIPVLSECTACRMQIEHLSRHKTMHPIQLMAQVYDI